MANIQVPFETAEETGVTLSLEIPDKNFTESFVPEEPKGIGDLESALLRAVERPVGGKKFSELVRRGVKVTFVTENQFRAAPANQLLKPLLKRAKDAGAEVSLAIGCGKVPALSPEEIEEKLGKEVVDMGIPIECNDVAQAGNYTFLGITSAGTPLWVLNSVAKADVVITISTTQATLWGYGGSGMIIPAVTGNETTEINHIMSVAPDCVPGNNDCRMQLDKYEALKMAGVDMGINVIVANNWDIIYINAGDPVMSHKEAVQFYEGIYRFDAKRLGKFDIVIAGSTAPTDHLFFHTGWAVVNCSPICKEGGTIIFSSPCPGYHDWPGFALMDLMKEYMPPTPETHERVLKSFYVKERELWAGCIWYPLFRSMLHRDVQIVTRPENVEMAKNAGLNVGVSLEETLKKALAKHGENARVAFVPYGRYTVFDA
ncbi:MAG: lactate racemase domain-containing protein [Pseudomonadota bacterium]